jgi:hypothetical protein
MTVPPADATQTMRRAADAMRQGAGSARTSASGRWYVRTPQGGFPQGISDNASAILVADCHEGPQHPQAMAPFIASWDPCVALLVAGLLDTIAADIDAVMADHGGAWFGTVPAEWLAAHDLATAYLKETTR